MVRERRKRKDLLKNFKDNMNKFWKGVNEVGKGESLVLSSARKAHCIVNQKREQKVKLNQSLFTKSGATFSGKRK